jgi:pimeloyl-ACP methyl ester carboxylesterase
MEPRIQYARTSDGVSIAYWTFGEGAVLVQTPPVPFSQVQLAALMPEDRDWGESMFAMRRLVRYDARGTGLSDRQVTDLSLEAHIRDLEAVVDHVGADNFVLWGQVTSGPIAITYAARHPDRVSRLILWSCWSRSSDLLRLPQARGLLALVEADWQLFTETAAHAFFGWSSGELAHRAAEFMREGISAETAKAMVDALSDFDVTDLLPSVRAPTLVMHRSDGGTFVVR